MPRRPLEPFGQRGRGTLQMVILSCINNHPSKSVSWCVMQLLTPSRVWALIAAQNAKTPLHSLNRRSKIRVPNAPFHSQCIRNPKC
jgi:hypothetical protein